MRQKSIKRGQGRAEAYKILKNKIQFLEILPGSVINESELTLELEMSRTPIREALIQLSEEYLVEMYPQAGTYVSLINFDLAREVAYMRHLLDSDVCMKLCHEQSKISDKVDESLYFMSSAIKHKDVAEYIRHDNHFHGKMFDSAGHSMIWDIISNSRAHYNRILMLDLRRQDKLETSYEQHKKIVEYIEAGDRDSLTEIMDVHHDHNMDIAFETEIKKMNLEYFPEK